MSGTVCTVVWRRWSKVDRRQEWARRCAGVLVVDRVVPTASVLYRAVSIRTIEQYWRVIAVSDLTMPPKWRYRPYRNRGQVVQFLPRHSAPYNRKVPNTLIFLLHMCGEKWLAWKSHSLWSSKSQATHCVQIPHTITCTFDSLLKIPRPMIRRLDFMFKNPTTHDSWARHIFKHPTTNDSWTRRSFKKLRLLIITRRRDSRSKRPMTSSTSQSDASQSRSRHSCQQFLPLQPLQYSNKASHSNSTLVNKSTKHSPDLFKLAPTRPQGQCHLQN